MPAQAPQGCGRIVKAHAFPTGRLDRKASPETVFAVEVGLENVQVGILQRETKLLMDQFF
jgi:hypothetical protein